MADKEKKEKVWDLMGMRVVESAPGEFKVPASELNKFYDEHDVPKAVREAVAAADTQLQVGAAEFVGQRLIEAGKADPSILQEGCGRQRIEIGGSANRFTVWVDPIATSVNPSTKEEIKREAVFTIKHSMKAPSAFTKEGGEIDKIRNDIKAALFSK